MGGGGSNVAEYSQLDGVVSDDFGHATHGITDAQYVELMSTYNSRTAADYDNVFCFAGVGLRFCEQTTWSDCGINRLTLMYPQCILPISIYWRFCMATRSNNLVY